MNLQGNHTGRLLEIADWICAGSFITIFFYITRRVLSCSQVLCYLSVVYMGSLGKISTISFARVGRLKKEIHCVVQRSKVRVLRLCSLVDVVCSFQVLLHNINPFESLLQQPCIHDARIYIELIVLV